jgi:hypothetical protein
MQNRRKVIKPFSKHIPPVTLQSNNIKVSARDGRQTDETWSIVQWPVG